MNKIGTIILLLFSTNIFGQNLSQCGIDNSPKLTQAESEFLNKYMDNEQRKGIDLTGKKAIFVTAPGASRIGNKSQYFEHIKLYEKDGRKISTWVIELNEEEKHQSDYDIIVTYWVKLLTKRRKRKILKEIKASR